MYKKSPHRFALTALAGTILFTGMLSAQRISASAAAVSAQTEANVQTVSVGFFDVNTNDWFCDDIMRLAETGIINGYPDGGFYPERSITTAEFIKLIITLIGSPFDNSLNEILFDGHWAAGYITLAHHLGIITDDELGADFSPDKPITRGEMAKMLCKILELKEETELFPFSDSTDPHAAALYKEYIYRGVPVSHDVRLSLDNSAAKRCEAAALAARVLDYRKDRDNFKSAAVLENASVYQLNHEFELVDLFRVLNREFISDFVLKTPYSYEDWIQIYRKSNIIHLEDFYASYLNCEYVKNSGIYTLHLEYEADTEMLIKYRNEAESAADKAVGAIITPEMSDREKIKAIHDYIILNCSYDYKNYVSGTISFDSRLAYGALCAKNAVCQGYTAAFNMLAKRAGIYSEVVTGNAPGNGDTHAWNKVTLDGKTYYLDVTHDDPVPDQLGRISYRYFMLTDEEMTALGYVWEREIPENDDNTQISIHG